MTVHDVIVIGGGVSGATLLHRLAIAGLDVLLLEAGAGLGGVMRSVRTRAGALVETGPNSLQRPPKPLWDMILELGLENRVVPASEQARNRYIMRDGRLLAAPSGPREFLRCELFSRRAKIRVARERFVKPAPPDREESVAQFVERRLGRELLDLAVDPFISGIYAGDPEQLSMRHAFARMYALEQEHGSLIKGAMRLARQRKRARKAAGNAAPAPTTPAAMVSFADGMAELPRAIEQRWRQNIRFGAGVRAISGYRGGWQVILANGETMHARHVVVATPALAAAELTESLSAELAARLRTVQYPPVATSAMLYDRAAVEHPLDGFGMLIPGSERRTILGAIFSSTLFPGRAPDGTVLLTAFVGGTRSPERALAAIPDLEFEVHAELRRTLGIGARPIEATTTVWPAAIPQYTLGYDRVLGAIAQAEAAHAGLHLIGNYRGGISVGDCVTNATALAEQLVAEFNGVRPVMPAPGEIPADEHDGGHGAAAEIQPDDTTGLLSDVEHATEIRQ